MYILAGVNCRSIIIIINNTARKTSTCIDWGVCHGGGSLHIANRVKLDARGRDGSGQCGFMRMNLVFAMVESRELHCNLHYRPDRAIFGAIELPTAHAPRESCHCHWPRQMKLLGPRSIIPGMVVGTLHRPRRWHLHIMLHSSKGAGGRDDAWMPLLRFRPQLSCNQAWTASFAALGSPTRLRRRERSWREKRGGRRRKREERGRVERFYHCV